VFLGEKFMQFSFFPPISIEGPVIEKNLNITGVESLKVIQISSKDISFTLEEDGESQTIKVLNFNNPMNEIHTRIDLDEKFPLELMPIVTIEFLEEMANLIGGYSLIYTLPPKSGLLEFFRGDLYPISVRGANKHLYATTAELRPLRKDYFVALNNLLETDFEEQLETSLSTFIENVLRPMSLTMQEVFSLDNSLDRDESVINMIGSDFKRLVTRTEDLISIVNYNMEHTANRNKAYLRLTIPLMLKQALLDNFNDYISIKHSNNSIVLEVKKRKTITTEDLYKIISKLFH